MKVLCNSSRCTYCKEGQCTKDEIKIVEYSYFDMGYYEEDIVKTVTCRSKENIRNI